MKKMVIGLVLASLLLSLTACSSAQQPETKAEAAEEVSTAAEAAEEVSTAAETAAEEAADIRQEASEADQSLQAGNVLEGAQEQAAAMGALPQIIQDKDDKEEAGSGSGTSFSHGVSDDTGYKNESLGFGFKLPAGWSIEKDEELAKRNGLTGKLSLSVQMATEIMAGKYMIDLFADGKTDGNVNMNVFFDAATASALGLKNVSMKQYVKDNLSTIRKSLESAGVTVSDISTNETQKFPKDDYGCYDIKGKYMSTDIYYRTLTFRQGAYFGTVTATGGDTASLDKIYDCFYSLKEDTNTWTTTLKGAVKFSYDWEKLVVFVKDVTEGFDDNLKRAGVTKERIEEVMGQTECLVYPAEKAFEETPYLAYISIGTGWADKGDNLKEMRRADDERLEAFYENFREYTSVNEETFEDINGKEYARYADEDRDYYVTILNGYAVIYEVVYHSGQQEAATSWFKEFEKTVQPLETE